MARESAQMAGQLAFRGRAPQLKLPQFSPLSLFFSPLLQLKVLARNFSRLAGLYRSVHHVKGRAAQFLGGGAGGKLSTDQWDHRYQWNLNRGASKVSLAAINSLII